MKKTLMFVAIFSSLFLLLSACSPKSVDTVTSPGIVLEQGIIAEGVLMPKNSMDQSFMISGQVAEMLVNDGDSVKAGQALVRLNNSPEAEASLARAQQDALAAQQTLDALIESSDIRLTQSKLAYIDAINQVDQIKTLLEDEDSDENRARLDAAEATLKQTENTLAILEDGNGVDPDELAKVQAILASANAAVASAQYIIDSLTLKSSIDGIVVDLSLQVGQYVTAGVPVMIIADYSNWVVKTDNLAELDVTKIKLGQKAEIVLDALPGVTLQGVVTNINNRYEEKRGDITYTTTIQLDQTDPQMRWGMTAAVYFIP